MTTYQTIAALLTCVAVGGYLNQRFFRLPATIGYMAFALLLSLGAISLYKFGLLDIAPVKEVIGGIDFSEVLLHGMLSFLLFAGALHIRFGDLREVGLSVAVLATAGVLMAAGITGALVWQAARLVGVDLSYIDALLFGALISPTDPIAVLAILKSAGMSKKLYAKVGGESLFNDGVGVVVFMSVLSLAMGTGPLDVAGAAQMLAREALGGLALGGGLGWITARILRTTDDYKVEVLLTLALVSAGSVLAEAVHVSAPIAMVTAGLVVGSIGHSHNKFHVFWEQVDEILNAVLFLLIGFEIIVITITQSDILLGLLAIAAVLTGRLISVGLPVGLMGLREEFEKGTVFTLVWGGLRGGLSIAMALSLPMGPARDVILPVTYIVVLFSILVQGLSFRHLLKRVLR